MSGSAKRGVDQYRAIARERVGPVKPAQIIKDKKLRKKPKHKMPLGDEAEETSG